MKRTEWRKFVDYFGLSIEADPSKVGKKNVHFFRIGYIPRPSYGNPPIERQSMDKQFDLEPTKLWLYQLTKKLAADIAPHISSALRDLGLFFDRSILYRSPILVDSDCGGTADS